MDKLGLTYDPELHRRGTGVPFDDEDIEQLHEVLHAVQTPK